MPANTVWGDERAVEGMPIRLVVAVAVGAAAFGLLVPMAESVEQRTETEITADPHQQQLTVDSADSTTATIDVVTTDGNPVEDVTVLVSGRSVQVTDDPLQFETGPDSNSVSFDVGTTSDADVPVEFRPTQNRGTISLSLVAPPGTEYTDEISNPELTIRRVNNRDDELFRLVGA